MRRLLYLWLALLGAYWAATAAISTIVAGRIDRGEIAVLSMVAVPIAQALSLGWFTRERRRGLGLALPAGLSGHAIRILVAVDVLVAVLGGLLPEDSLFTLNTGGVIPHVFAAGQSLAAAGCAAALARRNRGDRLPLALLAVALAGYAIDAGFGALSVVPQYLQAGGSGFAPWLIVHAAAALAGGALLLFLEQRWRNLPSQPGRPLEIALGLGILAGFGSVLGIRMPTEIGQPIFMVGCLCGFLVITAILAALLRRWAAEPEAD